MLPRLSVGIDEAGRGCVLGPLVVAVVAATEADKRKFREWNVRDSKLVPAKQREDLAKRIMDRCWFELRIAEPPAIDAAIADRTRTLNGLERELMTELVLAYRARHPEHPVRITIDAPSINARGFTQQMHTANGWTDDATLRAIHHADALDRSVGAASIIAKYERERLLAALKREIGADFGSGYTSDERTIMHLKTAPEGAVYVRWSWSTAQRLAPSGAGQRLAP
jgi:ribonuclease HII